MTPEQARTCMEFLRRVDLKGHEAPALVDVAGALEEIINADQGHTNRAQGAGVQGVRTEEPSFG